MRKRIGTIVLLLIAVPLPSGAAPVELAPPFDSAEAYDECSEPGALLNSCATDAVGNPADGHATVSVQIESPLEGSLPWFGDAYAAVEFRSLYEVLTPASKLRYTLRIRIDEAEAVDARTAPFGEMRAGITISSFHSSCPACFGAAGADIAYPAGALGAGEHVLSFDMTGPHDGSGIPVGDVTFILSLYAAVESGELFSVPLVQAGSAEIGIDLTATSLSVEAILP